MFDRENENYVYELVSKNIKKIRKERKRPFFDNCYQKWSFLKNLK